MATKQRELSIKEIGKWIKSIFPYSEFSSNIDDAKELVAALVSDECYRFPLGPEPYNFTIITERFPVRQVVTEFKKSSKLFSYIKSIIEEDSDTVFTNGYYLLVSDNTLVGKDSLFLLFFTQEPVSEDHYALVFDPLKEWLQNKRRIPVIFTGSLGSVVIEPEVGPVDINVVALKLSTYKIPE